MVFGACEETFCDSQSIHPQLVMCLNVQADLPVGESAGSQAA